ncbi:MAG: TetR/AcrR family transcriptional regulator [Syntrophales bacterium]|jgi:AcrR family transcriptional regulator|nr:TetR/AcrR family transcriptional regulator [Syntrophales bacterium]
MAKKYQNTHVRQKQIIEAARKLIFKHGSEHVTVRRIAHEVGISEAAIYRHFTSKNSILSFLADYIGDLLLSYVTESREAGGNSLEQLNAVLKKQISAVEQKRGISFQVIAEIISLGDKKLNRKVLENIEKYLGNIRDLIAEGIRSGEIRKDIEPEMAAVALFGVIQGLVNVWTLSNRNFNILSRYESLWAMYRSFLAETK